MVNYLLTTRGTTTITMLSYNNFKWEGVDDGGV